MAYTFFLLAQSCLAVSVVGIIAIVAKPLLSEASGISFSRMPFHFDVCSKLLRRKTVKDILKKKKRIKLKKDYWDKLLK